MRIRARISLARTEDGGRTTPISSDYRPDWDIGQRLPDGQIGYFMGRIMDLEARAASPRRDL